MRENKMRILVTGHKGFVGKYFMRKYQGNEIVGVDLKDGNDCRDFFKSDDSYFDMVIHLAAIVGGRVTIEGNPLSVATDLSIDAEMFNWAMRTRPGRIVYFSSSAAYPTKYQDNKYPQTLREDMLDLYAISNPDLTYGWAKMTGEYLAQFTEKAGIRTHVFRPFSGYGTDQDLDYPFPSYIARALREDDPFEIWGDGLQVRDFIHMQDIVDAVDKAIELDIPGPINLGSGIATPFIELADRVTNIKGYSPKYNFIGSAPVGVTYRVSNPKKMFDFYTPKISLNDGIKMALEGII
jgi:nucleoside-diphosphate-sugar epimerase